MEIEALDQSQRDWDLKLLSAFRTIRTAVNKKTKETQFCVTSGFEARNAGDIVTRNLKKCKTCSLAQEVDSQKDEASQRVALTDMNRMELLLLNDICVLQFCCWDCAKKVCLLWCGLERQCEHVGEFERDLCYPKSTNKLNIIQRQRRSFSAINSIFACDLQ